ncbi:putative transcriptional regulator [Paraburkholderia piptadeniae]|uniref:Transcriptional regulator n=1 Tax=Paraburkholderia piptadeniae TaxID=1701573 RepID=A0A1N7RW04_9BURK|nr:IclR family transcriptional regulator [Paraburkholderia piptadeniae]SIT39295.1 putative transcriptional regulator [Paraburkholderia piptadeniae]
MSDSNSDIEKSDRIPRLERVAMILEAINRSDQGLTLVEISSQTEMPMPSAHRLVNNMLDAGFLVGQRGRSRYRIGPRLIRIFQSSLSLETLQALAEPTLQRIADRFGQVAYLVRLVQDSIQLAVTVLPSSPSRNLIYPGNVFPLNATASAKALLAFQSEAVIDQQLQGPLEKYRPNTIVDPEKLRAKLADVREQGYAISDDEFDPGVYSICCPVLIGSAGALYGVGIVALKERLLMSFDTEAVVQSLKEAAGELRTTLQSTGLHAVSDVESEVDA